MASKLPVWGIDVGQCSLKAIKLQQSGDGVDLVGFDLVDHAQILSQAEADVTDLVAKAIETFVARNDLSNSRVVVSVAGQQTLTRFTKMPPVEPKKIPDMVQYEASQQIPFDMDEVVWDYQVCAGGAEVAEVEVGIFAIRKELIRSHLSQFTEKGIEPVAVQTSPMASYNAARFELESAEGEAAVLLDMGAVATDLIVMEGDRIWSRPVPIGGNRFTEALVAAFKIPFKKAERLKRNAAASKYARQIFHAMRPVFADLVSEIQRSIGFYTSTHRQAKITRVVCMGNAFKLPGLQKFLQQNLQIKVEKLSGFKKLATGAVEKKAEFEDNIMSLAVSYGLALQGLGLAAVESNLLPAEVRRTLLWRKKRSWFAASAACLALTAGVLWVGNVTAMGELHKGFGNLDPTRLRPPVFSTPQQAWQVITASASDAPIERAAKLIGAATKLEQAYRAVDVPSPAESTLKLLAEYPERNPYIPKILDVVHRAFAETASPELRAARSIEAYLQGPARIPRTERKEVWIERMQMVYSDAPALVFTGGNTAKAKRGKKGWAIKLIGLTTERNPASWLESHLISAMLQLGRNPAHGFYFDKISLVKVSERGKKTISQTKSSFGGDNRRGGRPAGRGGGHVGGRGGGGDDGPKLTVPGGDKPPVESGVDALSWRRKFEGKDPLTMEENDKDYRFELQIVVRKGKIPKDKIPDVYKPKKEEKKPKTAENERR